LPYRVATIGGTGVTEASLKIENGGADHPAHGCAPRENRQTNTYQIDGVHRAQRAA